MKLTKETFAELLESMEAVYFNWNFPKPDERPEVFNAWVRYLAGSVSEELFPLVIDDWVRTEVDPPKSVAALIQHSIDVVKQRYGDPDTETDIIIDSARKAYSNDSDFSDFCYEHPDATIDSFIIYNIKENSSTPRVSIEVYCKHKGGLRDSFNNGEEHGTEFLRDQIKKTWNKKATESVKQFLLSGETDIDHYKLLDSGTNLKYLEA